MDKSKLVVNLTAFAGAALAYIAMDGSSNVAMGMRSGFVGGAAGAGVGMLIVGMYRRYRMKRQG